MKLLNCFLLTFCALVAGAGELFSSRFEPAVVGKQWIGIGELMRRHCLQFTSAGMIVNAIPQKDKNQKADLLPVTGKLPDRYVVEFTAEYLDSKGDAHYGVTVNGVQLVIRKSVWPFGSNLAGSTRSLQGFSNGNVRIPVCYRVVNLPEKILVFADGVNILIVPKKQPGDNQVGFYAWNTKVLFSSVKITTAEACASPNLVRNGGFETVSGTLPEYWGTAWWGIVNPQWATRRDEFVRHWHLDSQTAYEGKNSFSIDVPAPDDNLTFALCSCTLYLEKNQPYTVSAWMKAEKAGTPVDFRLRGTAKNLIRLTPEWRRYCFTTTAGNARSQLVIEPRESGKIWVDAVQIEAGTAATAYETHLADRMTAESSPTPVNVCAPFAVKPPVIDGVLNDKAWSQAERLELRYRTDGAPLRNRTMAYLLCDKDSLYVAVECFDSEMKNLRAEVKQHNGKVWNDDAVEIFLKPSPSSDMYYQFAINSIGTKYEGLTFADPVWKWSWKTAVKTYPDRWVVEAAIPFSTLSSLPSDHRLGFNLGRENPRIREFSSLAKLSSFNDFRQFSTLTLELPAGQAVKTADVRPAPALVREYSVFSGEPELRFRFIGLQNCRYRYELQKDGQTIASGQGANHVLSLPNRYGPGDFRLNVTVMADGMSPLKFTDEFKVIAPRPYESKVNYWRRTLVSGGQDFYLWGILLEMQQANDDLVRYLASYGFNTIEMGGWFPHGTPYPTAMVKSTLDSCQRYGLKGIYNFQAGGNRIDGLIDYMKNVGPHPAQLLAMTFDEPSFKGFDAKTSAWIDAEYRRLHQAIGYSLATFQNDYELGVVRKFNYTHADLVGLDHYPVPMRDIASTATLLKKLQQLAGHRPVMLYTQFGGNAYHIPRLPDRAELINQYYQGMALDCWNFIAFANLPVEAWFLPTLKELKAERDALLAAGVNNGNDMPEIRGTSEDILFLARSTPAGRYLIAVNLTRKQLTGEFHGLPEKSVSVKFENRTLSTPDHTLRDRFQPLERHVYQF